MELQNFSTNILFPSKTTKLITFLITLMYLQKFCDVQNSLIPVVIVVNLLTTDDIIVSKNCTQHNRV